MPAPFYQREGIVLYLGDNREILPQLEPESISAVCTDPPYGLEFMGKEWDSFKTGRSAKYSKGGELTHTEFKNLGTLPSYVNRPAKRCGNCGKQAWSGSPCQCDEPRWIMDNSPLHAFQAFMTVFAQTIMPVMKPGAHIASFGGTRTFHRLAVAIEDAGFEVRDTLMWLYGSGFPKSLDVSKAIDKAKDDYPAIRAVVEFVRAAAISTDHNAESINAALGWGSAVAHHFLAPSRTNAGVPKWEQWLQLKALLGFGDEMDAEVWRLNGRKGKPGDNWDKREVVGTSDNGIAGGSKQHAGQNDAWGFNGEYDITSPATDAARQWDGWGTSLKPSFEPVILARKPLSGTVAATVLQHGTGALNIDASRVGTTDRWKATGKQSAPSTSYQGGVDGSLNVSVSSTHDAGRWPPNIILDDAAAEVLDAQSGDRPAGAWPKGKIRRQGVGNVPFGTDSYNEERRTTETGGASRFFPRLPVDDPDVSDDQSEAKGSPVRTPSRAGTGSSESTIPEIRLPVDDRDTTRFLYTAKASRRERNAGLDVKPQRMKLRDDLTPEQRAWVLSQLEASGVSL